MKRRGLAVACVVAACARTAGGPTEPSAPPPSATADAAVGASDFAAAAASVATPVLDLHADLAWAVRGRGRKLGDPAFELSAERLRRGGVRALVVPLFVDDASAQPAAKVRAEYEATWRALEAARPAAKVTVLLSFEGADGFADAPDAVLPWIARGACLFGLVHARTNALGGASQEPIRARRAAGLSPEGTALARRVLRAGALLDVAHASDATFDDLARLAAEVGAPLVDSHTGMRALVAVDRNLDDDRARAVAASGGVIGISLHAGHVGRTPGEPATIDDVAEHLEHAVRVAGPEHVALGSDLGGDIVPPLDGDGAATFPLLEARLRARGWTEARVRAVFWENAARVLLWPPAHGCGTAPSAPALGENDGHVLRHAQRPGAGRQHLDAGPRHQNGVLELRGQ